MKSILFVLCLMLTVNCYAIKPDRVYMDFPDSLDLKYSRQTIKTKDGCNLNSWLIKPVAAKDNKTTLILAYGDSGNMSYWLHHAKVMTDSGFTVMMFDYRGFGKSADFSINPDYLYYNEFGTDLRAVINWSKKNLQQNRTGIYAFSMGTIAATLALQHEQVNFLVGEGYVYDPIATVAKIKTLRGRDTSLPEGADIYVSLLGKIKCEMLLIAGEYDEITSVGDSEKVIRMSKNRKLVKFNGGHGEGFMKLTKESFGDEYINLLAAFTKNL